MKYAIPVKKDMVSASSSLPISTKNSVKICRAINRKELYKAKKILNDLLIEKINIEGKYFTKTVREILRLLNSAEANARARGLDPDKMKVYISAHKGPKLLRVRRRRKHGMRLKMTHIQVVLKGEENGRRKKVHKSSDKK